MSPGAGNGRSRPGSQTMWPGRRRAQELSPMAIGEMPGIRRRVAYLRFHKRWANPASGIRPGTVYSAYPMRALT